MVAHRNEDNKRILTKYLSSTPHIHLYGTPDCGILETLRTIEKDIHETRMVLINCLSIEGCAKNLLSQVSKGLKLRHSKCDSIHNLQQGLDIFCNEKKDRLICVLLECHVLNAFTPSYLKAFFDIAKKTANNRFSFVTVSHLSWVGFQRDVNACAAEPISLSFKVPSTEELVENISNEEGIPVQFVKNCVDYLIPTSNNPNVIKNMIREAWTNTDKDEWSCATGLKKYLAKLETCKERDISEWLDSSSSLLTAASKLVLVASYCASHNHPASDKRYFIKTHNKEKVRPNQKLKETTGVPKMFDLERLLFIREALLQLYPELKNDSIGIEPKLLVNSLVSMNRLILVSSKENIDWPKLKCVTPFETIRQLSQTIGISDINIHLEF